MTLCSVCKRRGGQISFYSVPNDSRKRALWHKACNMKLSKCAKVCADHFAPSDIYITAKKQYLMPSAIPSLNIPQAAPILDYLTDLSNDSGSDATNCDNEREEANKDPQIKKLISAVRRRKAFIDHRQPQQEIAALKQSIWTEIAHECNSQSASATEVLWNTLHDCFMSCYRNKLIRLVRAYYDEESLGKLPEEESTSEHSDTWIYYKDMRFVAKLSKKSNDPEIKRLIQLLGPVKQNFKRRKLACNATNGSTSTTDNSILAEKTQSDTDSASEKNIIDTNAISAEATIETVHLDVPSIDTKDFAAQDMDLHSFFEAMFRATRSMPPSQQRQIKRQLLESVHNAQEMNELAPTNNKQFEFYNC